MKKFEDRRPVGTTGPQRFGVVLNETSGIHQFITSGEETFLIQASEGRFPNGGKVVFTPVIGHRSKLKGTRYRRAINVCPAS
jgi:hypothetical protein